MKVISDIVGKPNLVFIMADDMGYGDLGCYGAKKIPTPNMDHIADEGILFSDTHSPSSVCTPSRYSVLTGRYCWRGNRKRGVNNGFSLPLIDPSRLTVASLLKKHGYATAAVGKWHLGLEWQLKDEYVREDQGKIDYLRPHVLETNSWEDPGCVDFSKPIIGGPMRLGFDYFYGIAGSLDMPPYCFIENESTVGIPIVEKEPYNPQQWKGFMTPGWRDEEVDIRFTEKAIEFIERCGTDHTPQPFFLYLTPSAPHRPCVPPNFLKGSSQAGSRGDMVVLVDWVVGEVVKTLERLGLSENTLIIVTSDNGAQPADVDGETYGHKSCGELRGFKGDIWDGGHRVPFLARWPGRINSGSRSDELICLSDLLATCAEIVGAELPFDSGEDSASILPILLGETLNEPVHEAVVHHSVFGMFAIRQAQWKLIFGTGSGSSREPHANDPAPDVLIPQLYDMVDDLGETHNLWSKRSQVVKCLSSLMNRYRQAGRSCVRIEGR
jgi:arylsulfatase A-like enzyme